MSVDSSRKAGGQRTGSRKACPGARRLAPKPAAESEAGRVVVVTAEQRQHLIEDVAFFHAERFRQIEPGNCRRQDLRDAEAETESVLKKHKRK